MNSNSIFIRAAWILVFTAAVGTVKLRGQEAEPYHVQTVTVSGSRIVNLDSSAVNDRADQQNHTWWFTFKKLTVSSATAEALKGGTSIDKPGLDWQAALIPGNVYKTKEGPDTVWLKKVFYLDSDRDHKAALSLHLGRITDRDIVYLNGQEIGRTGQWDTKIPQAYDKDRIYDIPEGILRYKADNVILIHAQTIFKSEIGPVTGVTEIGPSSRIWAKHYNRNYIEVLFLMLYAAVAGYFLFLFIRQLKSKENLFFGVFTMLLIIYQFCRTQIKYELGFDLLTMKRAEYFALFFFFFSFYFFLRSFFGLPVNKIILF
ncbi:MAG: beta galactosidase jelly roll domain-containing protein [Leptospiraceae bacterium]|nr:beta galactosidase jelly roll domain-containing protein [Leptospiraceae bacterium]